MAWEYATVAAFCSIAAALVVAVLLATAVVRVSRKGRDTVGIGAATPPAESTPAPLQVAPRFLAVVIGRSILVAAFGFLFPVASVLRRWVANGAGTLAFVEIVLFISVVALGGLYVSSAADLDGE